MKGENAITHAATSASLIRLKNEQTMEKNKDFELSPQFVDDIRQIINKGLGTASKVVADAAIYTYWNVGKRIVEEEQQGQTRAQYGKKIIPALAESLKNNYGGGYGRRNLAYYRKFYLAFPNFKILHTCVQNLTWSHIRLLIHVEDEKSRMWYMKEATECAWSVRTLERNLTTQYYNRRFAAQREKRDLPTPVIVKGAVAADNNVYTFTHRTLSNEDPVVTQGSMKFTGNYTLMADIYTSAEDRYVIGTDNYIYAASDQWTTSLKCTRAYIAAPSGTRVKIKVNDASTAIDAIAPDSVPTTSSLIYTLSGQRVNHISKGGIYIVYGKKVWVK